MKYLEWSLEDMEEDTDLDDPLGNIKILGDEGFIEENDTYIDAFLEAFVEGVRRMEVEDVIIIDPIVEPNDLVFNCKDNTIKINYGLQKATILSKDQFIEELQNAVDIFLKRLDEFANKSNQKIRDFTKLRNFLVKI